MKGNSKSIKWLFRVLTTVCVAVIYYLIFSLLFDTPIEHELKKSTDKLAEHYAKLEARYDSIQQVLDNMNQRDSSVYKIIYEAEPYSPITQNTASRLELQSKLSKMSNKELGEEFAARLSSTVQKVYTGNEIISKLSNEFSDDPDRINSLPSIQPIDNTDLTLLATSFGRRINPFYKTMQKHDGIDYNVPVGTAVFATADGVIDEIQTRGSNNGLSMRINHSNGYTTTYAYLSRTYGQVGQHVNRGDVIAFTGNSGMSYAPHLHYEVQYKGKAVDPLGYMFLELDIHKAEMMRRIAAHAMQAFD